jgi:hypothetical protein
MGHVKHTRDAIEAETAHGLGSIGADSAKDTRSDGEDAHKTWATLNRAIVGYRLSQAIHVSAKLGLADLLKGKASSCDSLARATGTHAPSLYRLLRLLASEGIFRELPGRCFALTPSAELLRDDIPNSLRPIALMEGGTWIWQSWSELLHSVRTGRPGFARVHGAAFFDYLIQHPREAAIFNRAMASQTTEAVEAVIEAVDLSGIGTLVDIGGGRGTLLIAALRAYSRMQGVLFDLPAVIEEARTLIESADVASRCVLETGDFFEYVPSGGDAYLLKFIIHDWDDEPAMEILRSCRRAMAAGGRLLLVEMVIPPGGQPHYAKFLDLNMLVLLAGKERTESEYRDLLAAAGFTLTKVTPTQSPLCIIEARPL